jgi:hypothetical protein
MVILFDSIFSVRCPIEAVQFVVELADEAN